MGNLNCTFFTRKSQYDRRRNLEIVCKAIQSVSNILNVRINERDDIVVNNGLNANVDKKVSKIGNLGKLYSGMIPTSHHEITQRFPILLFFCRYQELQQS